MDNTETLVLYVCSVSEVLFCFVLDGRQCLSSNAMSLFLF